MGTIGSRLRAPGPEGAGAARRHSAPVREIASPNVDGVDRLLEGDEEDARLSIPASRFVGEPGGPVGALSMESRFDVAVLHVAGLVNPIMVPEVNPLNHLSRVTLPVLMLNGRLDASFPLETRARPFFELLGTPPEHKRFTVAESGHFVPQPKLIRESLEWLDRYLGPVH